MRTHRILIVLSSLAVVSGGLFGLAPTASANSVQVQSYQRATQSEVCAAQTGETPWEDAWAPDSTWHPTWEQWANHGTGGWTCTRSITWAKTIGCVQVQLDVDGVVWANFESGDFLSAGAQGFADQYCSIVSEIAGYDGVWASDLAQADIRCDAVWRGTDAFHPDWATPNLFRCGIPD
jgi:hypothetical protein